MLRLVAQFLLKLFFRVEVRGTMQHHPKMLIISNHQSFLDGIIIGAFLPVEPYWLVHSTIARQWHFKILLKLIHYLEIDTSSPMVMKVAMEKIESGKPVAIFPEGRITITGSLMKIYEGTGFMAAKTGAMVVPVHLSGPRYAKWFSRMSGDFPQRWFPKITLTIHPPRFMPMPEAPTGKERRRIAGDQMRRLMEEVEVASRKDTTIYEAFLDAAGTYGRHRKFIEDIQFKPESYGHAIKASMALGRLVGKFTEPGEVVGVLLPNVSTTVYLLFGLFATRRVPAMMNYTAGLDGMQSALRAAKIRHILTSRAFLEKAKLTLIAAKLQNVEIVYLEDLRPRFTLADKLWLMLWAVRFPRLAMERPRPEDPAVVLFTSGSEGKPKGVVLSHRNILVNIDQVKAKVPFSSKDKLLASMPVFHSFGLTVTVLLPILNGCRLFLYPSPLHYRVVPELAYDRDCTVLFGTNTFLKHYANRAHPLDLHMVRYVVTGAEKLTEEVRRIYADKFGVRVIEGYGATECAPIVAANSPARNKPGTVGELMPAMEYRIEPVPGIDEGGILHVRGPNVMLGYWKEANPGVLEPPQSLYGPGWYSTGDLAVVDSDGCVALKGRMKRFAKVAGEMVSLEVTEILAGRASPHKIHASTAVPDANRGEMVVLVTSDAALKRDQLQQAARELGIPELAIPRRILYIDKVPLLGSGKKDYPAVARLVEQALAEPVKR